MEVLDTTDFIEKELFTERYSVNEDIDPNWPILTILGEKEDNSLEGKMKLAKELFLVMVKSAIEMPFDFKKFEDGPYTKQIQYGVNELENRGLVETEKKYRYKENDCIEFKLTERGKQKYNHDIKRKLEKQKPILETFRRIKSTPLSGSRLADKCYADFKLKKDVDSKDFWVKKRRKWIENIKNKIEDLLSSKFKTHISRNLEYDLLMPVNYSQNIIEEGELRPYDTDFQVRSGVVLVIIEEILEIVESILKIVNSKKPEKDDFEDVKNGLKQLDRFFYFLNQYSERYDIYPSLYNEENDSYEFLTEGEKSRMKKVISS